MSTMTTGIEDNYRDEFSEHETDRVSQRDFHRDDGKEGRGGEETRMSHRHNGYRGDGGNSENLNKSMSSSRESLARRGSGGGGEKKGVKDRRGGGTGGDQSDDQSVDESWRKKEKDRRESSASVMNGNVDRRSSQHTEGPNVIVTAADVHSSRDDSEDGDKMDDSPKQMRRGSDRNDRHNRGHSADKKNDQRSNKYNRKYSSHHNLSHDSSKDESEEGMRRAQSHHFTPQMGRKSNYNGRLGSGDESDSGSLARATSIANIGGGGGEGVEFVMPKSKMGSFQDFGPIKHGQSTTRVSTAKGWWACWLLSFNVVV